MANGPHTWNRMWLEKSLGTESAGTSDAEKSSTQGKKNEKENRIINAEKKMSFFSISPAVFMRNAPSFTCQPHHPRE